jgi:hypothetical protein
MSSCGGLEGGFQRVAHNLHFMKPPTIVTTVGIASIVAFKVEAVEPNS